MKSLEWAVEASVLAREAFERLAETEDRLDEVARRVMTRLDSEEFRSVIDNLREEAACEAHTERRRMLAHAAAGIVNVDLTIAEIARVERTLRELDPDDIIELASFLSVEDAYTLDGTAAVSEELDALMGAGCIRMAPGSLGVLDDPDHLELRVTRHGRLVVDVLGSYVAARRETPES